MKRRLTLICIGLVSLSGCATSADYGCKAPDGVTCKTVSEVYRESLSGKIQPTSKDDTASQRCAEDEGACTQQSGLDSKDKDRTSGRYSPALASKDSLPLPRIKPGDPIRIEPRILRVWMSPWEDDAGAYHDQS